MSEFTRTLALTRAIDSDPTALLAWLKTNLTDKQAADLEEYMLPEADELTKLMDARALLVAQLGEKNKAVTSLDEQINSITATEAIVAEKG